MLLTSSAIGRSNYEYELRSNIPAYDEAPGLQPRWELKVCPSCTHRFWAKTDRQVYCEMRCMYRAANKRYWAKRKEEAA